MSSDRQPGALVLVIGPSGAGKDTLLDGARRQFRDDPRFRFPKRVIARPPHPSEDFFSTTEAEFRSALANGEFALHWYAHGTYYGIPRSIDTAIAGGRVVIVNASRTIVTEARAKYQNLRLLLIDCDPAIRAQRLAARGRETIEEVEARIRRQVDEFLPAHADIVIDNSTAAELGIAQFVTALREVATDVAA